MPAWSHHLRVLAAIDVSRGIKWQVSYHETWSQLFRKKESAGFLIDEPWSVLTCLYYRAPSLVREEKSLPFRPICGDFYVHRIHDERGLGLTNQLEADLLVEPVALGVVDVPGAPHHVFPVGNGRIACSSLPAIEFEETSVQQGNPQLPGPLSRSSGLSEPGQTCPKKARRSMKFDTFRSSLMS